MALDERARNRMHNRFREVMGDDVADPVMDSLSPTGWHDLATKQDLVAVETRLESKLEVLEHKLTASFERGLRAQTRTFVLANAGMTIALAGYFSTVR